MVEVIATDSQKVREEIEVALKKDSRRGRKTIKKTSSKEKCNGMFPL